MNGLLLHTRQSTRSLLKLPWYLLAGEGHPVVHELYSLTYKDSLVHGSGFMPFLMVQIF